MSKQLLLPRSNYSLVKFGYLLNIRLLFSSYFCLFFVYKQAVPINYYHKTIICWANFSTVQGFPILSKCTCKRLSFCIWLNELSILMVTQIIKKSSFFLSHQQLATELKWNLTKSESRFSALQGYLHFNITARQEYTPMKEIFKILVGGIKSCPPVADSQSWIVIFLKKIHVSHRQKNMILLKIGSFCCLKFQCPF